MWVEAVTIAAAKVTAAAERGDGLEDDESMSEDEPSMASIDANLSGCARCATIGDTCNDCLQADIDETELEDLESIEDLNDSDDE
jgi:hypothetical protein